MFIEKEQSFDILNVVKNCSFLARVRNKRHVLYICNFHVMFYCIELVLKNTRTCMINFQIRCLACTLWFYVTVEFIRECDIVVVDHCLCSFSFYMFYRTHLALICMANQIWGIRLKKKVTQLLLTCGIPKTSSVS